MPVLPLILPAPIGGGDLVFNDVNDIIAIEADFIRESDSAPVRDAIRNGLLAMFRAYENSSSRAAALMDVLTSEGIYLDGVGADHQVFRADGENDSDYRLRILFNGDVTTPTAVLAIAESILQPYTAIPPVYLESIRDRGYCTDGTPSFRAYVRSGSVAGNCDPTYTDRLFYDDRAANGGDYIAARHPGGFWCFSETLGRYFILRIPSLDAIDTEVANVFDGTSPLEAIGAGAFSFDGTSTAFNTYYYVSATTSEAVYSAIATSVSRIVGQSIRWQLEVDPLLTA